MNDTLKRVILKPGDTLNLNLDLKFGLTKHIEFNKQELEVFLIEQVKKFLEGEI